METRVRPATADDAEALIDLSYRTIRARYTSFLGEDAVEGWLGAGNVERFVEAELAGAIVIEADGAVAGYAVCKDDLLHQMMIDERLHRAGLGARLLAAAEARLGESHASWWLESFAANDPANRFYRKHGWTESGRTIDAKSGAEMIVFRKSRG